MPDLDLISQSKPPKYRQSRQIVYGKMRKKQLLKVGEHGLSSPYGPTALALLRFPRPGPPMPVPTAPTMPARDPMEVKQALINYGCIIPKEAGARELQMQLLLGPRIA